MSCVYLTHLLFYGNNQGQTGVMCGICAWSVRMYMVWHVNAFIFQKFQKKVPVSVFTPVRLLVVGVVELE